jgi:hypothetical protein
VIVHRAPDAVLFDRDGNLVVDVPYNGDPAEVRPVPGAGEALDVLGAAVLRVPTAVPRPEEVAAAPVVRTELSDAVRHLLDPVRER